MTNNFDADRQDIALKKHYDEQIIKTIESILSSKMQGRVHVSKDLRAQHSHTTTYLKSQLPDLVVFPENIQ